MSRVSAEFTFHVITNPAPLAFPPTASDITNYDNSPTHTERRAKSRQQSCKQRETKKLRRTSDWGLTPSYAPVAVPSSHGVVRA